jgi:hypothetical protein
MAMVSQSPQAEHETKGLDARVLGEECRHQLDARAAAAKTPF